MAAGIHKLTAQQVKRARKALGDGGNLWINPKGGSKVWLFKYRINGRNREMGLGPYPEVGLTEARELAAKYRKVLKVDKRDPIQVRDEERIKQQKIHPTFTMAAGRYILTHRHEWRNKKHAKQWITTMRKYAKPVIGDKKVTEITTEDILEILKPIWLEKTETAKRIQGRIENIMDWARAMKYRAGDNPARWRGHLNQLLPKPNKVKTKRHHPAMPYKELSGFYQELRKTEGYSARALQFLILTTARTGDVLGAVWDEIDFEEGVWTIPENRTKTRVEHRVPLGDELISILEGLHRSGKYIFPSVKEGKPLSNMAMLTQMRRMDYGNYVPHGFRSAFRDWVAEQTNFSRELAEKALSHVVGNEVERAYQCGDMFEKRRRLMESWEKFALGELKDNVIEL